MNARERFISTIRFEKLDRPLRWEAPAIWEATIRKWYLEGLPENISCKNITDSEIYEYFDMEAPKWLPFQGGWIGDPYYPMFEYRVIEDMGENVIIEDVDGIVKKIRKEDPDGSMPQFLTFPVQTRQDYEKRIVPRYDYKSRGRFPEDWSKLVLEYKERKFVLGMFVIGPFGHLRNLMGDETLMYTLYDDPEFIDEIITRWTHFYEGFISIVTNEVTPDLIIIWEDMCYKSGPLVSPAMYVKYLANPLSKVIKTARARGIEGIVVDNDGDCSKMLPIYLDCGANAFFPFEVQANMNIVKVREEYGKRFTIIGGLDKRTLAINEEAIVEEIKQKVPFLLSEGGYIPMIDHSVPSNVTMKMFRFYLDYLRTIGMTVGK